MEQYLRFKHNLHAELQLASSGAWSYTLSNSNINYVGSDSFVVRVTDDDGHTADQTVSLTVIDLNPPVITLALR